MTCILNILRNISIHALREEGDGKVEKLLFFRRNISIHALREEGDSFSLVNSPVSSISIHALREEGDLGKPFVVDGENISIHALREEGDAILELLKKAIIEFLSTPSARRATRGVLLCGRTGQNFYPRPPRGGRP